MSWICACYGLIMPRAFRADAAVCLHSMTMAVSIHQTTCPAAVLCVQDPMPDDDVTEDPGVLPRHHHQLPKASAQQELQPWQARLAGHAEGIQQLDRDSLCRLSDPCQKPSKRSRSCPPDSFGAEAYQPADSTEAAHATQDDDPISDDDDAVSAGHSGLCAAEEPVLASDHQSIQQQQADALAVPSAATHWAVPLPVPAAQPAQQHDSMDMTQPNLTPAGPRQRQQPGAIHDPDSDPRTAPIRACPSSSPRASHADLDPDLDCDMLPAAETSHCHPQLNPAVAAQTDQTHRPLKQCTLDRQTSALPRVSKVKATKWKQKGGQRAGAFAENDHPQLAAAVAVPRQQGGEAGQQCWLQSGVGGHEGAAVLGETAQRARVGGGGGGGGRRGGGRQQRGQGGVGTSSTRRWCEAKLIGQLFRSCLLSSLSKCCCTCSIWCWCECVRACAQPAAAVKSLHHAVLLAVQLAQQDLF